MRLTVLGGGGGIPAADGACSGYLLETGDVRLLIDPGYGTAVALSRYCRAAAIDAVYVSHSHPDHCADLNPLLRLRVLGEHCAQPLPIFCPPGAVDAVLALEPNPFLTGAYELHAFEPGDDFTIGPFDVRTAALAHTVPNAGARFTVDGRSLTYTGDSGPCDALVELAAGTGVLLAESTYVDGVDDEYVGRLNDATGAGRMATAAKARRLLLCHVWPGADHDALRGAAQRTYDGPVDVAAADTTIAI